MSTQTLRHLCDAMDALDAARAATLDGMIEDTIDAARDKVSFAMTDTVAAFDIEAGEVDRQYWRAGYEAALEDFEITEEDVAAHNLAFGDEPTDDLYDAICGLFEVGKISRAVFDTLIDALEAGGKVALITAAERMRENQRIGADTLLAILASVR